MPFVVDYEEFTELVNEVKELRGEVSFLKSRIVNQKWMTRQQAMAALTCSDGTLKRLTDLQKIVHRYEGTKPFYEVDSIRSYLTVKKVDTKEAEQRVLGAFLTERKEIKT